jgi:hypothetical protein
MTNGDHTTRQLEVFKGFADAFATRDTTNILQIFSKDFVFKTFPKAAELPDLTKEEYLQKYRMIFPAFAKIEVSALYLGSHSSSHADAHNP